MILRQVAHEDVGRSSYLVADSGRAVVVDPHWDVSPYLALAEREGLLITGIVETHLHSDHVSGRARLAAATAAEVHLPEGAGVRHPHGVLRDGDALPVGRASLDVVHLPGHRPEHIGLLARGADGRPAGLLSGESLLVGDVAVPDAGVAAREGARALRRSLGRIRRLPGDLRVWPGRLPGAGRNSSTVAHETATNPFMASSSEEAFTERVLTRPAGFPVHAAALLDVDRGLPPARPAALPLLGPGQVAVRIAAGVTVVDARAGGQGPRGGRFPRAVTMPRAPRGAGARVAATVDPGTPVLVVADTEVAARRAAGLLEAVGFRRLMGVCAGDAVGPAGDLAVEAATP